MEKDCTMTAGSAIAEFLEDAGNHRLHEETSLVPLRDSVFSEQQKLRFVLDWAHSFLSSNSEAHREVCRADSPKLAETTHRKTHQRITYNYSTSSKYNHPASYTAESGEVSEGKGSMEKLCQLDSDHNSEQNNYLRRYKPLEEDFHVSFSFPSWLEGKETGNIELHHTTSKQTPSQDKFRKSGQHMSNLRHETDIYDRTSNLTDTVTPFIKGSSSSWKDASKTSSCAECPVKSSLKNGDEGVLSGDPKKLRKEFVEMEMYGRMEEKDGKVYTNDKLILRKSEKIPEQMEKTGSSSLKIPSHLTVYEQYQMCVGHLKLRQSQLTGPGCITESPKEERKTFEEIAAATPCLESSPNPEITTCLNKAQSKRPTASGSITENQDRATYERNQVKVPEHGETEHCADFSSKVTLAGAGAESRSLCQNNKADLNLNRNNHDDPPKRTTGAITPAEKDINTSVELLKAAPADVEESAALAANPGTIKKIWSNLCMFYYISYFCLLNLLQF